MQKTTTDTTVRAPTLLDFSGEAGLEGWDARGQNFGVAWRRATDNSDAAGFVVESPDEILLMVLDAPVTIERRDAQETAVKAPPRTLCIAPPGAWRLALSPGATCIALTSLRENTPCPAHNAAAYAERDARIAPVGTPWRALSGADTVRLLPIDEVQASKDKPRLKMLQTATLSINWVEYDGPRDRTALSPHAHASFEQGSLGLAGNFVHHLRVPWGEDANLWQEDRHAALGSPSLMVVPVGLTHTSEGVGPGHHLLIDIFSPPRADFIANGWVANSKDYAAPDLPTGR